MEPANGAARRSPIELQVRTSAGKDRWAGVWFWGDDRPRELPVRRDDSLDAWLVEGQRGRVRVVTASGARGLVLRDIRGRASPPLGWTLLAVAGLLAAFACFGASSALGDLASPGDDARAAWIEARRGDLSLVALAALLCASALLVAALASGFLT